MKTSSSLSRKITTTFTGLTLLIITALTLTSCKKEESQQPTSDQSAGINQKQNMQVPPWLVFKSIKIDHYAAGTRMQDYSVTVNANGTGLYEGRHNVTTIGKRQLDVSDRDLRKLNDLCIQFMEISRPRLSQQSDARAIALPTVVTTYTSINKLSSGQFFDHNNAQPVWLVMFRTQVEQVLHISKFTNATASLQMVDVAE